MVGAGRSVRQDDALATTGKTDVVFAILAIVAFALMIMAMMYVMTMVCLRRRLRRRSRESRRRDGTYAVAMTSPPDIVFAWLESHGVGRAQLESMCPLTKQDGCEGEMDMCVICLEQFEIGVDKRQLPCRHEFHARCIEVWLCKANRCPVCNWSVQFERVRRKRRGVKPIWSALRPMHLVDNEHPERALAQVHASSAS